MVQVLPLCIKLCHAVGRGDWDNMKYWFLSKDSLVFVSSMPVTDYIETLLSKVDEKKFAMVVMRLKKKNAKINQN